MNARLSMPRPLLAIVAALGLLFALDLFALGALRKLDRAITEVAQQARGLATVSALPPIVIDMQAGVRGYLLTGESGPLAQYRAASESFPAAVEAALAFAGDDPALREPIQAASTLTAQWLETRLSPLVVKRNAGEGSRATMDAILESLKRGRGDALAVRIRERLAVALHVQEVRLESARDRLQAVSDEAAGWMQARAVALLLAVAALALMLGRTLVRLTGQTSSREAAERTARESSAMLEAMNEASPLGMFAADPAGACVHNNVAMERISGLTADRLAGAGWLAALHPDDRDRVSAAWRDAVSQGRPFASEHRFLHRNGNVVWVAIKGAPVHDGDRLIGHVCTVEDVSERRNAEDGFRRSEARLQLALEGNRVALFDWHLPSGEILLSRQWVALTGHGEETAATARRFAELLHEDDREALRDALVATLKGRVAVLGTQFRVRTASGTWKRLACHGQVTERDAVGRAVQLTGTLRAAD
jgi:PAS domain S-box-containing protein